MKILWIAILALICGALLGWDRKEETPGSQREDEGLSDRSPGKVWSSKEDAEPDPEWVSMAGLIQAVKSVEEL